MKATYDSGVQVDVSLTRILRRKTVSLLSEKPFDALPPSSLTSLFAVVIFVLVCLRSEGRLLSPSFF